VLIAQRTGQPVGRIPPFTTRPPLTSSALKHFVLPEGARDAAVPTRRGGTDEK